MSGTLARSFARIASAAVTRQALFTSRVRTIPFVAVNTRLYSSELSTLLGSEIDGEQQLFNENYGSNPNFTSMGKYKITHDRAEVELTATAPAGKMVVSFNVNHSFAPADEVEAMGACVPLQTADFTVTIEKSGKKLAFECQVAPDEEKIAFDIIEVYMFEGESVDDNNYAVSGHVLDANLYDQLKAYLVEQGLDRQFIDEFKKLASQHEHKQYIDLLKAMNDFVK